MLWDDDRYYSGSVYVEALLHLSGGYRACDHSEDKVYANAALNLVGFVCASKSIDYTRGKKWLSLFRFCSLFTLRSFRRKCHELATNSSLVTVPFPSESNCVIIPF